MNFNLSLNSNLSLNLNSTGQVLNARKKVVSTMKTAFSVAAIKEFLDRMPAPAPLEALGEARSRLGARVASSEFRV